MSSEFTTEQKQAVIHVMEDAEQRNTVSHSPETEKVATESISTTSPDKTSRTPKSKLGYRGVFVTPPTRLTVSPKQLEILKNYAELSDGGVRRVTPSDVAGHTGIAPSTIASYSNFFKQNKFLIGQEGTRGFLPSQALLHFQNRLQVGTGDAALLELRPVIEETWFGREITQLIKSGKRPNDHDLLITLAVKAGAPVQDYKGSFAQLIEWCEITQLIRKESNGTYLLGNPNLRNTPQSDFEPENDVILPTTSSTNIGIDGIMAALSQTFDLRAMMKLEADSRIKLMQAIEDIEACVQELKAAKEK